MFAASLAAGYGLVRDGGEDDMTRAAVLVDGEDHLPNQTASEWVTHADYVVAVTAADEHHGPISPVERERGEGVVGRTVDLVVDDVLWARDRAASAPETISWAAYGSEFTGGKTSELKPMAGLQTPRVEVGHRYVIAVKWEPARCTTGPDAETDRWAGLGADAVLPFDDGVLGNGEFEGTFRSDEEAIAEAKRNGTEHNLAWEMLGQPGETLKARLAATKPDLSQVTAAPVPVCD